MAESVIAAVAGPFGRDLDRSFALIERSLVKARSAGASLVVFPECAVGGYIDGQPLGALDVDGPEIARLAELAGPTVVCAGFPERGPDGVYSSGVCLSGDGIYGVQRKVHLPPSEIGHFQPGEGFSAFDTPAGRLGMTICYDKVFPESGRSLALDGAEIIACMAAWPVCRFKPARSVRRDRQTFQYDLLDQARAVENQVVWVSSNLTGRLGPLRFVGGAKVVDPDGAVMARTSARPGVAVARVNVPQTLQGSRSLYSHLADRRPGSYRVPDGASPLPALG